MKEEAKQAEADYERARTQADKDYEETAAAVADKKPLTPDEEAELNRLWKKLVKLYHPDRFAHGKRIHLTPARSAFEAERESLRQTVCSAKRRDVHRQSDAPEEVGEGVRFAGRTGRKAK